MGFSHPPRTRLRVPSSLLAAIFLLGLLAAVTPPARVRAATNPIVAENQQAGSSGWQLGSLVADDVNGQVKGYASATSVLQGGSLSLYVSVNPAQTYAIDFYRIGWYGGLGGRLRLHAGPLGGISQPTCPEDSTTGLIACNWAPGYTFFIPSDWTSGAYVAVLTNSTGYQNYVLFVVRDGRPAAFLYQEGMNTSEAYNDYPNDNKTGKSLYEFNSYGANTIAGARRAVEVSFDRPFADDGSGLFLNWDIQLTRWLERSGYDVTYSTDIDTHTNGADLLNHKAFFSAGHDEYWSNEMFNAAQNARDSGVNLAFFGANAVYWQVRYASSATGVPNRVMVCYKDVSIDPVQGPTTTVRWRDAPVNRPEQSLMGVMFTSETGWGNNTGYVVTNSSNWVYAGTGFHNGDVVAGIVGYETDRLTTGYPPPSTTSQTLLSHSPYTNIDGLPDYANSSIYQASSGAWVFATGTMSWSWALDNYGTSVQADPRIQQTTVNVLSAFLSGAPVVHDLKLTAPTSVITGRAFTISVAAENSQGNAVTTYGGTIHFSTSDTSTGVVLPPDSTLTNGQGTFSVTLVKTGPQTVTVSDAVNNLSTTANLTVNPPAVAKLAVAAPTTGVAGQAFSVTVAAQDSSGNTVTTYNGTIHFSSSDTSAGVVLPPDSTLTNGQGTFSVTLIRAGSQTLTGSDAANNLSTTANLTVTAASASKLALAGQNTTTAGSSFSFAVTAQDPYGNTDPSYAGTVHFTTSDPSGSMPANATLVNGRGSFSATLDTAGSQTITAADTGKASISGSLTVQVAAAAAASITLSIPGTVQAKQPFDVTATLYDRFGNVASDYRGTVHFSSSDLLAQLPADYTFTSVDAGKHVFSVTLVTPPSQTLTVTDAANPSLITTTRPINVILL